MMKKWRVWQVVNEQTGQVLWCGRKAECVRFWYPRWCYERQPLVLVRTEQLYKTWSEA